jgi:phosphate transport system substrate-binding protein
MKHQWWYISLIFLGLFGPTGCIRQQPLPSIYIKGSDTEVNLVLQLAEAYMEIDSSVSICITGGGSGVGIAGLFNGNTEVANSSRGLNAYEEELAKKRGFDIHAFVFAYDALAIICHPQMPVDSLTLEELGQIFSGEKTDWVDASGEVYPLSLYGRQSNSGTYIYFREKIIGADYTSAMKQMNGNAQILEAVKSDPFAIGYIGLGYLANEDGSPREGVKIVRIKSSPGHPAVSPLDQQALQVGAYPLVRPLFQFTNGNPEGEIQSFFDFEKSEAGRAIISRNGYLPVPGSQITAHSR